LDLPHILAHKIKTRNKTLVEQAESYADIVQPTFAERYRDDILISDALDLQVA
jgi:hypothetical protein